MHGERIRVIVKFCSILMALWIQQSWRIPDTGLQQSIWHPKKDVLPGYSVIENIFGFAGNKIYNKYQCMHRFNFFCVAFLNQKFSYWQSMPVINLIDCK